MLILGGSSLGLKCFVDADHAGDVDDRKSTAGYLIYLNEGVVIWRSTKEPNVAVSSTESEYVAASIASRDVLWTRNLLRELGRGCDQATPVFMDNQGAIRIVRNPQMRGRVKHIDITYLFVRSLQERQEIDTKYIKSEEQIADALTKPLAREKLKNFKRLMSIKTVGANACNSISRIMLALTLMLSLAGALHGRKMTFNLLLDIEVPCSNIKTFFYYPSCNGTITGGELACMCNSYFAERIEPVLRNMRYCQASNKRKKRAKFDLTANVSGVGVTNLIKSHYQLTHRENFQEIQLKLRRLLKSDTKQDMERGMKDLVISELAKTSGSEVHQEEVSRYAVEHVPNDLRFPFT